MDRTRRLGSGALGGLVAGTALTALLLGIERSSRTPSDIVRLGRKAASALGSPYLHQESMPALDEQLRYHGGHLALSAAMGATYPALRTLPVVCGPGGSLLFGGAFYLLFWGLLGPRLSLTSTPREEGAATVARRVGLHALFGLVTGLVADALAPHGRKPGQHFVRGPATT